ncbi:MAG: hypothetical protein LBJ95_03900 [Oscillospiraceae bacterium]|jgi:hypothetical protein|nr:hypothetical protein [Oscillospiraceae bacterium]
MNHDQLEPQTREKPNRKSESQPRTLTEDELTVCTGGTSTTGLEGRNPNKPPG